MDRSESTPEDDAESFLTFMYLCPVGILQLDQDGFIRMMNPMAAQYLMAVARKPTIENLFDTLEYCAPDLRYLVASFHHSRGQICQNRRIVADAIGTAPGGGPRVLSCSLLKTEPNCIMAMLDDVSAQASQERRLADADSWMTAICSDVNDFVCFSLDAAGLIATWNQSGVKQTGFTFADVIGKSLDFFASSEGSCTTSDQLEGARREGWCLREGRCLRKDGPDFWCQILATPVSDEDGAIVGFSVVLRNVTARKMTADELRRLLTEDYLTGASNRAHFLDKAAAEVARCKRSANPLSVLMLDLDHFKRVNDQLGHACGDAVLRELVSRCRPSLRPADCLARFGGEEFVILLPGLDGVTAFQIGERIRLAVAKMPVSIDGLCAEVTVSIGCASLGDETDGVADLLKAADLALYEAKRLGRNRTCRHVPERDRDAGQEPGERAHRPLSRLSELGVAAL